MVFNFLSNSAQQLKDAVSSPEITSLGIASPDFLGHKPKNKEVIRIGRRPLMCVGIGLTAVAGVMTYTLVEKSIAAQSANQDDVKGAEASITAIPFLEKKPSNGIIGPDIKADSADSNKTVPAVTVPTPEATSTSPRSPYEDAEFQRWQQREQEKMQLEQAKHAEFKNALVAEQTVYSNSQAGASNQSGSNNPAALHGSVKQDADYSQPQQASVNIPAEASGNYLSHTRVQAASVFELKSGTVIPSVMLGGVNSDLPGQIMAQVSQNVYDSATGRYLLIPQGSKVIGSYDHQIVQGQNRVLVVWNRLIYPDASAVNLESMPGADGSGYAGFKDKSNTHFWPTFRNALMLSAITAGTQLSQPKVENGSTYSSQQMIAASMGMQLNNLGMQTISRNINQPPTIQVRPGYIFNVLINKDMILPPWQHGAVAYGGTD